MPVQTFPFTPGYSHTAVERFAVTVNRFEDTSEQRQLESAQRGLQLIYEWPLIDSCYVSGIASWFQANVGPGIVFQVLDHRTQTLYLAHHAENAFEVLHGAAQSRQLRLAFTTILSGTTSPVFTAFSRSLLTPCFTLSYTAPTTPTLPPDPFAPPSGTLIGQGNSTQFDAGADTHYWYMGSTSQIPQGWYWPARALGPTQIDGNQWTTLDTTANDLYATPFFCSRSGAIIEATGVYASNINLANSICVRVGVYAARSASTQLYPSSLVAATSMTVVSGMNTGSFNLQLQEGVLYFVAFQPLNRVFAAGITAGQGHAWIGVESTATAGEDLGWLVAGAGAMPATFPDSAVTFFQGPQPFLRIR